MSQRRICRLASAQAHHAAGAAAPGVSASGSLLANGTLFGACQVALRGQSKMLAGNAGVSAEAAAKEWTANVIAGITIIPSGTWGVNRAQEAGCSIAREAEADRA
jgi:hypothetical protein